MNHYQLFTKRILAWGIALPITFTLCGGVMYGIVVDKMEVVTMCVGILGTTIGAVVGFYFGKKMAEE